MLPIQTLSPTQQQALDELLHQARSSEVTVLAGSWGKGRSTVLRAACAELRGVLIDAREIIESMQNGNPMAIEETFYRLIFRSLDQNDYVIVDDLHLLTSTLLGHGYPRPGFLMVPLTALAAYAAEHSKHIIYGVDSHAYVGAYAAHAQIRISDFSPADFQAIAAKYLGQSAAAIDFVKVHRYASRLAATQLRNVAEALNGADNLDTELFLERLRATELISNVDLGEVQAVDLRDLKGMEDVLQAIEANVLLPLEQPDLANELSLRPKRGILLAGPPGTGKTTIGRALAHRIKSKFFLVDGTVIAGTGDFYGQIARIFDAATQNAPAIIFIDDSDVIFESGSELGLYRYLLTKLDGLESKSAGQVTLVLTTMDIGSVPPALVRSGRIELWLETRLPDEEARVAILNDVAATLPPAFAAFDATALAAATEGLSGADLRRVVEDGKLLYAYRRATGQPAAHLMDYFSEAVNKVRTNKEKYAEAEARARAQRPQRPPYFDGALAAGWTDVNWIEADVAS
jgi:ATP-dependent 26S proteasome regulatory subunit